MTHASPPVSAPYNPPSKNTHFKKIVLEWSATCQGRQFDRIFGVWLDGVELLRSCTAEPRATGIQWTVTKDVTRCSIPRTPRVPQMRCIRLTSESYKPRWGEDGLSVISTKLGTPLMPDSYTSDMCMQSWGMSSYVRAMIELQTNVELKDNIVAAMPKINREGHSTCNIRVELVKFLKDFRLARRWYLNLNSYQPVSKKTTANTGANKKKNVDPPKEVTNPFEVLTSVKNDDELDTNGGASNLASKAVSSSGSSFWNAESSSPSTTLIIEKINKMENLIIDGKAILVDNEGKPLRKVDDDSEDEVASDDNEMASFLAKMDSYGTQSLLEKWKDYHKLDDYEYDLYDDDMYEGQKIPEMLQAFCNNLDIKVRGRKKK
uniref:Peptide-N(4)-(N-acetyl-beta-glucosaminyl) asparagine amidase A n=1 Tax=Tanacetum cinerariifolium TaxID=118510 RepID=A0A6L2N3E9_TANCI|nr:peptide-N(4)-(N-acetyl-beta-glucosaminyl) asparagine amidase A [Tanacetum cinerariifolium]